MGRLSDQASYVYTKIFTKANLVKNSFDIFTCMTNIFNFSPGRPTLEFIHLMKHSRCMVEHCIHQFELFLYISFFHFFTIFYLNFCICLHILPIFCPISGHFLHNHVTFFHTFMSPFSDSHHSTRRPLQSQEIQLKRPQVLQDLKGINLPYYIHK